jgi:ribosome-binding protein aMBF1 (putative translation factor)
MSRELDALIADIEQEAAAEGPRAVRELERFREEFALASQIIASRRERELSQRQLATLSGVPQSEISRIETGAANPTYATITALLRSLGKRVQLVDDRPAVRPATHARKAPGGREASPGSSKRRGAARKTASRA